MNGFFRFPHTPHLAWLGRDAPRDDKLMTPAEIAHLLAAPVRVEEKLDGANLGLSVGPDGGIRAQNRGHYLEPPFAGQFKPLSAWVAAHEAALHAHLDAGLILFGEWCALRHFVEYTRLPDWFIAFDVYDRQQQAFWSAARRDRLCELIGLVSSPALRDGLHSLADLTALLDRPSAYVDGPMEGVVIRRDEGPWLSLRAKLVRPDFTQAIQSHWTRRTPERNRLV